VKKLEQRRELRNKGKLPVELGSGKGVTRDFSSSGIYFETDRSFSPGQAIEFTIVLRHIDPNSPVRLKCQGEIVRVEEDGSIMGVAAAIDSYTLEDTHQ